MFVLDLAHLPAGDESNVFLRVGAGELQTGLAIDSYPLTAVETWAPQATGVQACRRSLYPSAAWVTA
jgi:hypothetical protein